METYIVILRGINVSGQNKIKMEGLITHMELLGLKNVITYIQSGSLVFKHEITENADLTKRIEKKIFMEYGFGVTVLVKKAGEFEKIVINNLLLKNEMGYSTEELYASIFGKEIDLDPMDLLKETKDGKDEFIILGGVIYLYCPNGCGQTKFSNNFFETKLKIFATTHNWKTMIKLVELANNL